MSRTGNKCGMVKEEENAADGNYLIFVVNLLDMEVRDQLAARNGGFLKTHSSL